MRNQDLEVRILEYQPRTSVENKRTTLYDIHSYDCAAKISVRSRSDTAIYIALVDSILCDYPVDAYRAKGYKAWRDGSIMDVVDNLMMRARKTNTLRVKTLLPHSAEPAIFYVAYPSFKEKYPSRSPVPWTFDSLRLGLTYSVKNDKHENGRHLSFAIVAFDSTNRQRFLLPRELTFYKSL